MSTKGERAFKDADYGSGAGMTDFCLMLDKKITPPATALYIVISRYFKYRLSKSYSGIGGQAQPLYGRGAFYPLINGKRISSPCKGKTGGI
ncbi:MAG: hypothetical protein JW882_22075 [Deltaproteobacteria bacterium]|nr:hypothetical protein [Deltaproteobacteria bacterium]